MTTAHQADAYAAELRAQGYRTATRTVGVWAHRERAWLGGHLEVAVVDRPHVIVVPSRTFPGQIAYACGYRPMVGMAEVFSSAEAARERLEEDRSWGRKWAHREGVAVVPMPAEVAAWDGRSAGERRAA